LSETTIEWTNRTWNPTTGCDQVSPGCDHCYALTMAKRLKAMGNPRYQNDGNPITSGPGFGITIHEDLLEAPFGWKKPQMVFVNSMSDLFHDKVPLAFLQRAFAVMVATPQHTYQILTKRAMRVSRIADQLPWPANVWMGTSIEGPRQLMRGRWLLTIPAATRFLSCEPLLAPLYLGGLTRGIDWVIAGGESGPGARPCDPDWLRGLRDYCGLYEIPFFLKQLGGFPDKRGHDKAVLDGRLWREWPEPKAAA
jgi:protein gp37